MSLHESEGRMCLFKEDFGSVRSRLCAKDLLFHNKGGPLICRHGSHWCQRKPHIEFKCAMRPFASNSSQNLPHFNIQLWAEWDWDRFLKMLAEDPRWREVRKSLQFHGQVENPPEQTASSTVHKAARDQGIAVHTECQILAWRVLASFHLLQWRHADFHQLKIWF